MVAEALTALACSTMESQVAEWSVVNGGRVEIHVGQYLASAQWIVWESSYPRIPVAVTSRAVHPTDAARLLCRFSCPAPASRQIDNAAEPPEPRPTVPRLASTRMSRSTRRVRAARRYPRRFDPRARRADPDTLLTPRDRLRRRSRDANRATREDVCSQCRFMMTDIITDPAVSGLRACWPSRNLDTPIVTLTQTRRCTAAARARTIRHRGPLDGVRRGGPRACRSTADRWISAPSAKDCRCRPSRLSACRSWDHRESPERPAGLLAMSPTPPRQPARSTGRSARSTAATSHRGERGSLSLPTGRCRDLGDLSASRRRERLGPCLAALGRPKGTQGHSRRVAGIGQRWGLRGLACGLLDDLPGQLIGVTRTLGLACT